MGRMKPTRAADEAGVALLVYPDYSDLAVRGEPPRVLPYLGRNAELVRTASTAGVSIRLSPKGPPEGPRPATRPAGGGPPADGHT